MKYKDLVLNDKNCIKKTNKIFKTSVAECMLNRPIRFHKGEMFSVIKYKDFLLDNIDHIKETNKIFNAIPATCIVNRSISFHETVFKKMQTPSKIQMINFDDYANENKIKHNQKWSYIPDHPYRILIIGGSGSGKTNALLNLINNQPDIDKIYLYAKDPHEAQYQFLINKRESTGQNHFNDPKAFIEYSNDMEDVYENIDEYNINKERKILIVFDDMIADMINNKKLNSIVTCLLEEEN